MRVIAGNLKGRQIKSVLGSSTRPTGDKLKESLFNMIGPYFEGGHCLDLFAGSGSLGIEALSRGMDKVIFIDSSAPAIKTIKQNITQLQIENQCEVYRIDAFRSLQILAKKLQTFDLIFLDPPYEKVDYEKLMMKVQESNLIKTHGLIYVEHQPSEKINFNEKMLKLLHQKRYGSTTGITILQKIH